jgi:hypothetical protein
MATIDHGFDPAASVGFVYDAASNLTKELYHKQIGNRVGDRFGYDEHHRLRDAWLGSDAAHSVFRWQRLSMATCGAVGLRSGRHLRAEADLRPRRREQPSG